MGGEGGHSEIDHVLTDGRKEKFSLETCRMGRIRTGHAQLMVTIDTEKRVKTQMQVHKRKPYPKREKVSGDDPGWQTCTRSTAKGEVEIRKEGRKATTATSQWDEIVQTMNGAFDSAFPRNEKQRRNAGKTQREKERKYKRQLIGRRRRRGVAK